MNQEMKHLDHLVMLSLLWTQHIERSLVETQPDMMAYMVLPNARQQHQLAEIETSKIIPLLGIIYQGTKTHGQNFLCLDARARVTNYLEKALEKFRIFTISRPSSFYQNIDTRIFKLLSATELEVRTKIPK